MTANRPRFSRDESGISLTEGLIVFPIVMLIFAAFIEFGYAVHQWNQTVKALHYGARMAAVSDSVATGFNPATATNTANSGLVGNSFPVGMTWQCGGPSFPACNANINRIVGRMNALNPRIGVNNVIVTYMTTGLGYYGRPNGAVVTLRMQVTGITFDLPIIGALLGLNEIEIPFMPVTVTSEDLRTNSGA